MSIAQNILTIRQDIALLAPGRDVMLVAVTKTRTAEQINQLPECGVYNIGENRVQEWLSKKDLLDPRLAYHQIGQLQTNKVKYIVGHASLIQSVDRSALLGEIDKISRKNGLVSDILLEVNTGREPQKGGILPEEADALLEEALHLAGVRVCGLMCIAPKEGADAAFAHAKEIFDRWATLVDAPWFKHLSMGMSGDYKIALKNGSTMIRPGTSIFTQ